MATTSKGYWKLSLLEDDDLGYVYFECVTGKSVTKPSAVIDYLKQALEDRV